MMDGKLVLTIGTKDVDIRGGLTVRGVADRAWR